MDTTNLNNATKYLADILAQRIQQHLGTAISRPAETSFELELTEQSDPFSKFVAQEQLCWEDLILLLLALVPHLVPGFFEKVVGANLERDHDLPAFGGTRPPGQRHLMPTLATYLFLAGEDSIDHHLTLLRVVSADNSLFSRGILKLGELDETYSLLHRPIIINEEYLWLFLGQQKKEPAFSAAFPARRLQTQQEWADLVLAPQVLEQINEIRQWVLHGQTLLEEWGMAAKLKPGYRALFHGPPGTGKTLTATLLGKYTERDVFRVDLSTVVSKYIGETEKNLASLFDKAQDQNWILFFDEADALFGKRTNVKQAHDRFANQEVSYLLQRVEDFPGLVILASNFKANIDEAFLRRFQTIIKFPFPSRAERLRIWQNAFPKRVTFAEGPGLLEEVAEYELAGGDIINVVQYACLRALECGETLIHKDVILRGIRRELEKAGKIFKLQ